MLIGEVVGNAIGEEDVAFAEFVAFAGFETGADNEHNADEGGTGVDPSATLVDEAVGDASGSASGPFIGFVVVAGDFEDTGFGTGADDEDEGGTGDDVAFETKAVAVPSCQITCFLSKSTARKCARIQSKPRIRSTISPSTT